MEIGGAKRLKAISTAMVVAFLTPFALIEYAGTTTDLRDHLFSLTTLSALAFVIPVRWRKKGCLHSCDGSARKKRRERMGGKGGKGVEFT